jgi:hypothetical protein
MVWHTIFSIWIICAAFPFTCSLSFSSCIILLQGSHHHKTTKQNKFWTWKCHISTAKWTPESNEVSLENPGIKFYVVRSSYQLNWLWRLSRYRQWRHDNATKQNKLWTWRCHISTAKNPRVEWGIIQNLWYSTFYCEGKFQIHWALETLRADTMAPWQQNQTKWILNLKVPHHNR